MKERRGFAAAGNFIIDHVKIIDALPQEEHLAVIRSEGLGTGGGPYNILAGFAVLDPSLELEAIGKVGDDADGRRILEHLKSIGVDIRGMKTTAEAPTSYTDVMTVKATGRRTFFHNYGANALLAPEDFDFAAVRARIFHLAYLMLLNALDAPDPNDTSRTGAARVLEQAADAGLLTSVDIVSDLGPRILEVVPPALKHADFFIANELESAAISGIELRDSSGRLVRENFARAAAALLDLGVRREVVIHAPEGGFWKSRSGPEFFMPSLKVPQDFIAGTAGAGDAFCGGVLYGLHEGWAPEKSMRLGMAHAAQSLSHATCTGGCKPLAETLELIERFGFRETAQS